MTGPRGIVAIGFVPPGIYEVTARKGNLQASVTGVEVRAAGKPLRVGVALESDQ